MPAYARVDRYRLDSNNKIITLMDIYQKYALCDDASVATEPALHRAQTLFEQEVDLLLAGLVLTASI